MNDAVYQVSVAPYARSFRQPLHTSHGIWSVREGAIVTLTAPTGQRSQGEIAPLEWFGSETQQAALDFCASLNGRITAEQIFAIPDQRPCCQFAFETALNSLQSAAPKVTQQQHDAIKHHDLTEHNQTARSPTDHDQSLATQGDLPPHQIAALLPTGAAALTQWPTIYRRGHRSFKWKIGVADSRQEQQWFQALHQQLPKDCKFRLDANAGLSLEATIAWLDLLETHNIEFLEQPLDTTHLKTMQALASHYQTPLALDESIANLSQVTDCHKQGWQGIYVIKPAIVGSPQRLTELVQRHQLDIVCSSVFETEVGYTAALNLSQQIQNHDRAYGFGTKDWW